MRAVWLFALTGCDAALGLTVAVQADAPGLAPCCPSTYTHVAQGSFGGDYRIDSGWFGFLAAESACANDLATQGTGCFTHLAVAASLSELQLISQAIGPSNEYFWIGASNLADGTTWQWITNEAPALADTSALWEQGYPQASNGQCVHIDAITGQLINSPCSTTIQFACECDAVAPDPSHL